MTTLAQHSSDTLDFVVHWMWAAIEIALTYGWPLLLLGGAVIAWRSIKGR